MDSFKGRSPESEPLDMDCEESEDSTSSEFEEVDIYEWMEAERAEILDSRENPDYPIDPM